MPKKRDLVPTQIEFPPLTNDLPTVPDAFRRTDYEGFLEEWVKTFQLKRYQKTQAERITVLKQINQLQAECLAIARNEANWRHFAQEDRLRKKRLDIEEMELEYRMEDLLYERDRKLRERIKATAPATAPRRDPVEEITAQLEQAIRTEAGVKDVFTRARRDYPHLEDWLREWEGKITWDLRDKKWF